MKAGELLGGSKRYSHPVYAFYRTHVSLLLRESCGTDEATRVHGGRAAGPLAAEPFLYQRDLRGMSLDEIVAGWHGLCDAVLAGARADARLISPSA